MNMNQREQTGIIPGARIGARRGIRFHGWGCRRRKTLERLSCAAVAAAVIAFSSSAAAAGEFKFEVNPIFRSPGGAVPSAVNGRILPLRVRLRTAVGVKGEVRAYLMDRENRVTRLTLDSGPGEFAYEIGVGIPEKAGTPEIVVEATINGERMEELSLGFSGLRRFESGDVFNPVVTAWVSEAAEIPAAVHAFERQIMSSHVLAAPDDLPSDWRMYFGVDLVALGDADWNKIRPEKAAALISWLKAGGRVLIHGGTFRQGTGWFLASGLQVKGDANVVSIGEEEWPPGFGRLRESPEGEGKTSGERKAEFRMIDLGGGRVVSPGGSVYAARPFGLGTLVAVSADLDSAGMNAMEPDSLLLLSAANGFEIEEMSPPVSQYQNYPGESPAPDWAWAFEKAAKVPGVPAGAAAAVAVAFIILVGPVDYLFLRRYGMQRFTWFTTIAAAIAFSLGIHILMGEIRGARSLCVCAAIDDVHADGMRRRAWFSVFVPGDSRGYAAETTENGIMFDAGSFAGHGSDRTEFLAGGTRMEFSVPVWAGAAVSAVEYGPGGGYWRPDPLVLKGGIMSGSIESTGPNPIEAVLVYGGMVFAGEPGPDGAIRFDCRGNSEEDFQPDVTSFLVNRHVNSLETGFYPWKPGSGTAGPGAGVRKRAYASGRAVRYADWGFRLAGQLYCPFRTAGPGEGVLTIIFHGDARPAIDDGMMEVMCVRAERRMVPVKEEP